MVKAFAVPCLALSLAACQSVPPDEQAAPANSAYGLLIAQNSCGGCHAAGRTGSSPNPDAPPFVTIANREGLTPEALATWLRDIHHYPTEMGFVLERNQVEALVAYMMTLRYPDRDRQSSGAN